MTERERAKIANERALRDRAFRVIESISDETNNMCFDENGFAKFMAEKFGRTHRTLQQGIIRLLAAFISHVAEHDFDLRNEAAIKWCKKVKEIDRYFPLI